MSGTAAWFTDTDAVLGGIWLYAWVEIFAACWETCFKTSCCTWGVTFEREEKARLILAMFSTDTEPCAWDLCMDIWRAIALRLSMSTESELTSRAFWEKRIMRMGSVVILISGCIPKPPFNIDGMIYPPKDSIPCILAAKP